MLEINDAVSLNDLSHVYDTPVLQQLTMRLFTHIFLYLIKMMTWYTDRSRTRFLKSFNEDALRLFDEELAQVKQVSNLLSRQVQLYVSADVRVSKLLLEDLSGSMRYLLKYSEVDARFSRLQEAANAELIRNVVRCQLEKSKEEVKECILGHMTAYREAMRSGISGGGITNLLEQHASRSAQTSAQPSAAHVNDGGFALEITTACLSEAYESSKLIENVKI